MRLAIEIKRRVREELFPSLPVPGPSSSIRTTMKARGPAEEHEEQEEDTFRVDEWDYVGRRDATRHKEEGMIIRLDMDASRRSGHETMRHRQERPRVRIRHEGQKPQMGRRNSGREAELERESGNRFQRRRKTEAIVVHKNEQTDTYATILKQVKRNINIEDLCISDTRIRRTATGSLLFQIAEENSKIQADALAEQM